MSVEKTSTTKEEEEDDEVATSTATDEAKGVGAEDVDVTAASSETETESGAVKSSTEDEELRLMRRLSLIPGSEDEQIKLDLGDIELKGTHITDDIRKWPMSSWQKMWWNFP